MLPPVRLLADLNAAPATDLTASGDLPAGAGDFDTALAALFRPQAALPKPLAPGQSIPATGQSLPQGGKSLPVQALTGDVAGTHPEAAPVDLDALLALRASPEIGAIEPVATSDTDQAAQIELPLPAGVPSDFAATIAMPAMAIEHTALAASPPAAPEPAGIVPALQGRLRQIRPNAFVSPLSDDAALQTDSAAEAAAPARTQPDATGARLSQAGTAPAAPGFLLSDRPAIPAAAANLQAPLQIRPTATDVKEQKAAPIGTTPVSMFAVTPAHTSAAAPSSSAAAIPTMTAIALQPGSHGWGDALGDRVAWMAGHKIHNAEIRLNPADLGPLRVQISVDDGTANINFHAHHATTRDAIEQALPRLRDMLSDQGLSLGNTSVSDHGVTHDQAHADRHGNVSPSFPVDDEAVITAPDMAPLSTRMAAVGRVDLFA